MSEATRLLGGVSSAVTASDPGLVRLRLAGTTIATLAATLVVLGVLVTVAGRPVTVAMPGLVLAMIASIAVREDEPVRQAVSIALLVPAAVIGVGLGSVVGGRTLVTDAVFVVVAVSAVFLQRLGPRGTATGMVGFISYFLALFVGVSVGQLPAVVVAVAVGAVVCVLMRTLLRPRHHDRELRRMLAALGVRAGGVVELLGEGVRKGTLSPRLARRLRARVSRAGETAKSVEQHLDDADEPLLETIGNDELAVRVFDFQLAVESLGTAVDRMLRDDVPDLDVREDAATALAAVQTFLEDPARRSVLDSIDVLDTVSATKAATWSTDAAVSRLGWTMATGVDSWRRVVDPQPGDADSVAAERATPDEDASEDEDEDEDEESPPSSTVGDTARQATQVGVASALAIIAGTQLSSTRWYWAVITAFVVYVGTSTRGEILTKGWQRVLGTMVGVVVGVLVATLVGGSSVTSVVLIFVFLFLGVYLMPVSPAVMMFFITMMLALLFGLLGQFSVELLLVRLEETAAGALIGILVSYVVLPSSTREAAREAMGDFLDELADLLTQSADVLSGASFTQVPAGKRARALRDSFGDLRVTAKPLTDGLAGVPGRSGSRRTLQVLGACEHHGQLLSRVAEEAPGIAAAPEVSHVLHCAATAVRANVDAVAGGVKTRMSQAALDAAAPAIDDLELVAARLPDRDGAPLLAAARHLRAIDQAISDWATELGAHQALATAGDKTAAEEATETALGNRDR